MTKPLNRSLGLFARNARGAFTIPCGFFSENEFLGDHPIEDRRDLKDQLQDRFAVFFAVIYYPFSPLTIPFMAFFKTVFDVATRNNLEAQDKTDCISKIEAADFDQLQSVVDAIIKYNAHSNSSVRLQSELENLQHEFKNSYKLKIRDNVTWLKNQRRQTNEENSKDNLDDVRTKVSTLNPKFVTAKLDIVYSDELIEEDLKQLEQKNNEVKTTLESTMLQSQKELIISYLTEEINDGKKMQHIINEATSDIKVRIQLQ